MGVSIQDLKEAKQTIINNYNLSAADAARVVGYINTNNADIIQDILAGDCSGVPSVLAALGIGSAVKTAENVARDPAKKPCKRSAADDNIKAPSSLHSGVIQPAGMMGDNFTDNDNKSDMGENNADIMPAVIAQKNTSQSHDIQADIIPAENIQDILSAVDGDIIPASTDGDLLPAVLPSMVEDWLQEYALKYNIDLQKCAGLQWRGACLFVGQHFKNSDILLDKERTLSRNSKTYNPHKVAALIPLYEALTVTYKHIALACDFIAFSGVSREWFYDSQNKGLTSAAVDLRKKVLAIEESTLSAGLVDSRENPTGRIYYSKARLGWQETAPAMAAPVAVVVAVGDLPTLLDKKQ